MNSFSIKSYDLQIAFYDSNRGQVTEVQYSLQGSHGEIVFMNFGSDGDGKIAILSTTEAIGKYPIEQLERFETKLKTLFGLGDTTVSFGETNGIKSIVLAGQTVSPGQ